MKLKISSLEMCFVRLACTSEQICESVWQPDSSLYASSTCGQGFRIISSLALLAKVVVSNNLYLSNGADKKTIRRYSTLLSAALLENQTDVFFVFFFYFSLCYRAAEEMAILQEDKVQ